MRDRPEGAGLLAIARETLIRALLPHLPAERRYEARMVANAMAIAERELAAGDGPLRAEVARLAALYDEPAPAAAGRAEIEAAALRLNRCLVADIRAGAFDADDGRRARMLAHLEATARAMVLESNPGYLARPSTGDG